MPGRGDCEHCESASPTPASGKDPVPPFGEPGDDECRPDEEQSAGREAAAISDPESARQHTIHVRPADAFVHVEHPEHRHERDRERRPMPPKRPARSARATTRPRSALARAGAG